MCVAIHWNYALSFHQPIDDDAVEPWVHVPRPDIVLSVPGAAQEPNKESATDTEGQLSVRGSEYALVLSGAVFKGVVSVGVTYRAGSARHGHGVGIAIPAITGPAKKVPFIVRRPEPDEYGTIGVLRKEDVQVVAVRWSVDEWGERLAKVLVIFPILFLAVFIAVESCVASATLGDRQIAAVLAVTTWNLWVEY